MEDALRLTDFLDRFAEATPDHPALIEGARAISYAELRDRVRRAAGGLTALGLPPGSGKRVAVLERNQPAVLELIFAASEAGLAALVVNFRLAPGEVRFILSDAEVEVLFVGEEFASLVEALRPDLPALREVVVLDPAGRLHDAWLAQQARQAPLETSPDAGILQLYTSGTTGQPKGAVLTHRGVCAHIRNAAPLVGHDRSGVSLIATPFFHVGGICATLYGLFSGATAVLVRDLQPAVLVPEIERRRVTHAFVVPATLAFLLDLPDLEARDLSSLRSLAYGASPMPLPLLERCLRAFPSASFYQVYGMTELSGVVVILGAAEHADPRLRAAAGRPIPGVELRLRDAAGSEVAVGSPGELWVRSAQRMLGYWKNPQATAETIDPEGWLRTGDVGHLDSAGYLFIEDRLKDVILSGGENIYPAEIERALAGHPAIVELAVIGIPHPAWGEAVHAVVVRRPGGPSLEAAQLMAYARERLAGYKIPRSVEFVESLPRNATGKIQKHLLRGPHWAGLTRKI